MRRNLGRISVKFQKGQVNLEQQGYDLIQENLKKVQEGEVWLTEIYQRLAKDIKSSQDAIDNGKYVQEAMLSYMRQIKEWDSSSASETRLAEALQKAGEFQRCVDELRNQLYADLNAKCYQPLREFVKEELTAAKKAKKRCDAVRAKYESAQNQVKSLRAQKNILPTKLQVAEEELRDAKANFDSMSNETLNVFETTNQSNETKTLIRLCDYLGSYHNFFKSGFMWLENLMPMVEAYRAAAKQELEELEASKRGGRRARDSLRESRANGQSEAPLLKVFGAPLQEVLARENREIPLFLQNCIEHLSVHALETEGIFRISAIKDEIEAMKYRLDHGQPTIPTDADVHLVSNIVKLYFRELPEPLLTFDLFPKFVKANGIRDRDAQLEEIKSLISALPKGNQTVLKSLVRLCARLAKNESIHKMGAQNLAVVFTPNVLYSKESDPMSMVEEMASAQSVFTMIIESAAQLFPLPSDAFDSASRGHFLDVYDQIDENPSLLQAQDSDGSTLLHKAAGSGDVAFVTYLLRKGIDVNSKDNNGFSALYTSLLNPEKVVEVAAVLISKGAEEQSDFWGGLEALSNGSALAAKLKAILNAGQPPTPASSHPLLSIPTTPSTSPGLPRRAQNSEPISPAREEKPTEPTPVSAPSTPEATTTNTASAAPEPVTPAADKPSVSEPKADTGSEPPSVTVSKPVPKALVPKVTGIARVAVAMINIDEIADAMLQLVHADLALTKGSDIAAEVAKLTPIMKAIAESLKRLLLDVRGFANNFSEANKKEIIGSALLLQDKIRFVINAVKLLSSAPQDESNQKGFEDACRQFAEGVSKFFHACESGTNDTLERKIQEVAESITHILHATLGTDSEVLSKAHAAAITNSFGLSQLVILRGFTITSTASSLSKSAQLIETGVQSLVEASKDIFEKPKEQRSTERLTAITRTILLEFRKVKDLASAAPKELLNQAAELELNAASLKVVRDIVGEHRLVLSSGGEVKVKAAEAAEAIASSLGELVKESTLSSPENLATVNTALCIHLLDLSQVLPLLVETPTEALRLHSEAMVHIDIRLKLTSVVKLLTLKCGEKGSTGVLQDSRNQYAFAIQELASVVASTIDTIATQC